MKTLYVLVLVLAMSGCVNLTVEKTLLDGTQVRAQYIRLFNQQIDGVALVSPDGWELQITGQKSDTQIAFDLGAASVGVGGGQ